MSHGHAEASQFHDPVTGLPSGRVWSDGLAWAVERATTERPPRPLTVALLELEGLETRSADFRAVERDLKAIAAAWHERLEDSGLIARIIGGRFGLLLPDRDLPSALEVLEELRDLLPPGIGLSAGVAVWDGEGAGLLCGRADGALSGAREFGRERPVVAC